MVEVKFLKESEAMGLSGASDFIKFAKKEAEVSTLNYLDIFCLKNSEDFGKGYGKKAFLDLLEKENEAFLIIPSTVTFPDQFYIGRENAVENGDEGLFNLINLFYKPLLKRGGWKYKELKYKGMTLIVAIP